MVDITASMVRDLRLKTDAPLLECKKALTESDGDMDKAEQILRVRLGNRASKASSRVAAEGVVVIKISADQKQGILLEVNCETDFVCKNDQFIAFSNTLAELVLAKMPKTVEELSALTLADGKTVEETRVALVGKIGENISIRRFVPCAAKGLLAQYVHGSRIGVLVDYDGDATTARDVAMHVVASRPLCVTRDEVPTAVLEKERAIYQEQASQSGKPAEIVAKMVEGRISKYLSEISLVDQPFVKSPDQTVGQFIAANSTTVHHFHLVVVGEGIEKAVVDFAAEVAAASGQAS